jgi:hypothetical protein
MTDLNGQRQINTGNIALTSPTPEARSEDALASLAAIAQLRVEAQVAIDATVGEFQVGSYNTSPDKGEVK